MSLCFFFFFYFLLKHAEFSQFSISVEGWVAASASCQIKGLYKDVKKGTHSLDLSPNGGLYCSPCSSFAFHLFLLIFFPKFTKKSLLLITSYMIITNYVWKLSALKIHCIWWIRANKFIIEMTFNLFCCSAFWEGLLERDRWLIGDSKSLYLQLKVHVVVTAYLHVFSYQVTLGKTFLSQERKGHKNNLSSWNHHC